MAFGCSAVGAERPNLPGWSYRYQWWVSHDPHGVFMARGVHGQAIYVDPKAEMVIARFASHPLAGNVLLDPTSLPAYRAVATAQSRAPQLVPTPRYREPCDQYRSRLPPEPVSARS